MGGNSLIDEINRLHAPQFEVPTPLGSIIWVKYDRVPLRGNSSSQMRPLEHVARTDFVPPTFISVLGFKGVWSILEVEASQAE